MLDYLLGVVMIGTAGVVIHYALMFIEKRKALPPAPAMPKDEMMIREMRPVMRYEDSA